MFYKLSLLKRFENLIYFIHVFTLQTLDRGKNKKYVIKKRKST